MMLELSKFPVAAALAVALTCTAAPAHAGTEQTKEARPMRTLLKEGTKAPAWQALDTSGHLVKSDELTGKKPFVLWFYPKDDTPG